jgi:hypothetical protein
MVNARWGAAFLLLSYPVTFGNGWLIENMHE